MACKNLTTKMQTEPILYNHIKYKIDCNDKSVGVKE